MLPEQFGFGITDLFQQRTHGVHALLAEPGLLHAHYSIKLHLIGNDVAARRDYWLDAGCQPGFLGGFQFGQAIELGRIVADHGFDLVHMLAECRHTVFHRFQRIVFAGQGKTALASLDIDQALEYGVNFEHHLICVRVAIICLIGFVKVDISQQGNCCKQQYDDHESSLDTQTNF